MTGVREKTPNRVMSERFISKLLWLLHLAIHLKS